MERILFNCHKVSLSESNKIKFIQLAIPNLPKPRFSFDVLQVHFVTEWVGESERLDFGSIYETEEPILNPAIHDYVLHWENDAWKMMTQDDYHYIYGSNYGTWIGN